MHLLVAQRRMQPRRDSVYSLYMRNLPSSTWYGYRTGVMRRSTLTLLFLFECCCFTGGFIKSCPGLLTDCPCTLFLLHVSTHVLLIAIFFFGWYLYLAGVFVPHVERVLVAFINKTLIFLP